MVYRAKQEEATKALSDPAPDPANYPLLSATVNIDGPDIKSGAMIVDAKAKAWLTVGANIERTAALAIDQLNKGVEPKIVLAGLVWDV